MKLFRPITEPLNRLFRHKFNLWLGRRMPGAGQHQLSNRNIFILPSRFGLMYLLFVILLFLLGTNYQNNVIILLSYLLSSIFVTVMMHSFFNLSGLIFSGQRTHQGFANQQLSISLTITANKACHDLNVCFDGQPNLHIDSVQGTHVIDVPYISSIRGVFTPGRLKISSEYSFGLFKAWTRLDFDHQCIIYPSPKPFKNEMAINGDDNENGDTQGNSKSGIDEFYELKPYVLGEPLSRVAWKQFARGQGQLSKHYQQFTDNTVWLRLNDMPAVALEERLSYLCFLVLEYHQAAQCFGLDLQSKEIDPSVGEQHLNACLSALAFYPKRGAE